MMYPLSVEWYLMKKQAVSNNNAGVSAPAYMQVCLDCLDLICEGKPDALGGRWGVLY